MAPLYGVSSACNSSVLVNSDGVETTETKKRVSIPQSKLYTVSTAEESGIGYNDSYFGTFSDRSSHNGKYYLDMGYGHRTDGLGYAGVFKYYNNEASSFSNTYYDIEDGIISQTLPYFVQIKDSKGYVQFIGDRSYVNFTAGGRRQVSNHGVSAVLQLPVSFDPYITPTSVKDFCTALIANIKYNTIPYGGNTYISTIKVGNSIGATTKIASEVNSVVVADENSSLKNIVCTYGTDSERLPNAVKALPFADRWEPYSRIGIC